MRILIVHNHYQQPGGEDQVFADESALLGALGHDVECFTVHNDQLQEMGRVRSAVSTIWNRGLARRIGERIRRHGSEVVHFHNTFPLISPAAFCAARARGAAVIQTLHNYRLLCPRAQFLRDGRPCEECLGKTFPWPGVRHACYRDSRCASAAVAAMLTVHRLRGTWQNDIDVYIALTEFARQKFIEGGLPASRIIVKPNFVQPDPGPGPGGGGHVLFVGRLSAEKGIQTLLDAWRPGEMDVPLKIVGDGPLAPLVRQAAAGHPGIQWLGRRPLEEVCGCLGQAEALVFPSLWYEGLPRTIIEAFATGTPVIASRLGAMAGLVDDGRTGLLFEPGNARDLAARVRRCMDDAGLRQRMRAAARAEFEAGYTAERNGRMLERIYELAVAQRQPAAAVG
jgi:glycosyltransferase involved in cell wall biosynthesis